MMERILESLAQLFLLLALAPLVAASLIVLGLHQRSWIAKRVLGSTARSVVLPLRARC